MNAIGQAQITQLEIVEKFREYLNSPDGRVVRDSLDNGESFILTTKDCTMLIKRVGNMVTVELLDE